MSEKLSEEDHDERGMDAHPSPKIQTPLLRHIPSGVISMAPDIFETVPRQFLPNYKSPCWFNKQNKLYCLPYFYIIGMAKCGTTDLWDKITRHPHVLASVPKEPHWWSRRRRGIDTRNIPIHQKEARQISKMIGEKEDSSIDWYLNWYKTFGVKSIESSPSQNADGDVTFPKVFGDASISTSFDIGKTWEEGNYTNADLIHAVQPQAKIIMIVRNPTQRFSSQFHYNGFRDSPAALDHKAKEEISCFTSCLQEHSERYCTFRRSCRMLNAIYIAIAKDWMRVYGRDGVYILTLEDWYGNTGKEFEKLLKFLELPALPKDEISRITRRKPKNVNARNARSSMWNTTRDLLQDFFRPFNKRFASFMNDTRFLYDEG
ncbi:carbohydrate sulfotransferase 15 isoform X2 [Strongylocentrotus purpuratus]|nr:carbohydrate sulfotransferase 15 isoform X2 [Strongylocentrotus purpuratus]